MTTQIILAEEKLEMAALDRVAGGTVGELADLAAAMVSKYPVIAEIGKAEARVPGANYVLAGSVADILKNQLGISANIDLGWAGTDIGSEHNTYTEISTGKSLSHSEVLDIINHAGF